MDESEIESTLAAIVGGEAMDNGRDQLNTLFFYLVYLIEEKYNNRLMWESGLAGTEGGSRLDKERFIALSFIVATHSYPYPGRWHIKWQIKFLQ